MDLLWKIRIELSRRIHIKPTYLLLQDCLKKCLSQTTSLSVCTQIPEEIGDKWGNQQTRGQAKVVQREHTNLWQKKASGVTWTEEFSQLSRCRALSHIAKVLCHHLISTIADIFTQIQKDVMSNENVYHFAQHEHMHRKSQPSNHGHECSHNNHQNVQDISIAKLSIGKDQKP